MPGKQPQRDDSWRWEEHWTRQNVQRFDQARANMPPSGILPTREAHHAMVSEVTSSSSSAAPRPGPPQQLSPEMVRAANLGMYRMSELTSLDFQPRRHTYMVEGRPFQVSQRMQTVAHSDAILFEIPLACTGMCLPPSCRVDLCCVGSCSVVVAQCDVWHATVSFCCHCSLRSGDHPLAPESHSAGD